MYRKLSVLVVLLLALGGLLSLSREATAQGGVPPNQPKKGLVYDRLELPNDGSCPRAFRVKGVKADGRPLCTHGPDEAPATVSVSSSAMPVASTSLSTVCDGDGTSGYRIQVIYAHASDVLDRYSAYLASFQQWASDADAIYDASAAETGGSRHLRFVHDAACAPVVLDVTLTTTGDDNIGNMTAELQTQGYNRADRDYLVFVDANVYCGIGNWQWDDSASSSNLSNFGPNMRVWI